MAKKVAKSPIKKTPVKNATKKSARKKAAKKATSKKSAGVAVAFAPSPTDRFKEDRDVLDRNARTKEERYAVLVDAVDDWSDLDIHVIVRDESGTQYGWRMKPNVN